MLQEKGYIWNAAVLEERNEYSQIRGSQIPEENHIDLTLGEWIVWAISQIAEWLQQQERIPISIMLVMKGWRQVGILKK